MSADEQRLVGAWRLVSLLMNGPDGPYELYGPNANGWLIYSAEHRMSATLGRGTLPAVSSAAEASLEEARELLGAFAAYTGGWELDDNAGTVTHKIEYSFMGPPPGDRLRHYRFEDDRLILHSENAEIVWQRA